MPAWNRKIYVTDKARAALDVSNDPEYPARVADAERLVARTCDCGGDPTSEPLATYPPGHVSRMDNDGALDIFKAEAGTTVDRRPSKLRDAMERLKLSSTTPANRNQRNNVLERVAASDKLRDINQRNREKYGRKP